MSANVLSPWKPICTNLRFKRGDNRLRLNQNVSWFSPRTHLRKPPPGACVSRIRSEIWAEFMIIPERPSTFQSRLIDILRTSFHSSFRLGRRSWHHLSEWRIKVSWFNLFSLFSPDSSMLRPKQAQIEIYSRRPRNWVRHFVIAMVIFRSFPLFDNRTSRKALSIHKLAARA